MRELNKSFVAGILILLLGSLFSACATGGGGSSGGSSGGGDGVPAGAPPWVRNPGSVYPDSQYVVATGDGKSMEEAQYKARANLLGIFGMRLSDESVIAEMFQQTTANGNTSWNDTVSSDRKISSSAEGILSGCEIKENWNRGNEYFALAVMDKARTVSIYNDIIMRLSQDITEIINVPDINTIDGYSRYRLAATLAKDIDDCINVLRFVGGSGSVPAGLRSQSQYMTDASNIIKTIPVGITVTNDRSGRIQGAFAKALSDLGFRSGGGNARYVLVANISTDPVELAGQTNKFTRITVTANLTDTGANVVLVPFSFNSREGHATQAEADNRAYAAAERKIESDYKNAVSDYLAQLLPKK